MIVLSSSDISKSYGTDVVLDKISFSINQGDRVGIVGANGAGKTTLLNVLSEQIQPDEGNFFTAKDATIGYLKQKDNFKEGTTVLDTAKAVFSRFDVMEEEIESLNRQIAQLGKEGKEDSDEMNRAMSRLASLQESYENQGGFSYKSELYGILNSMAFDESYYDKPVDNLSGGERTRLALACLLLEKPDILLLDEPTNHLDIGTLKWLEQYLKGYKGTIVLISHDRYFLDQTVDRIFEVENHKLTVYEGNYTYYAGRKKELRESQLRAYNKQQTEIRRQEDMIRRFKERGTEKLAKRAASREKMLEKMERIDKPESLPDRMKLTFHQNFQSGNDVLYGENLSKKFGIGADSQEIFHNVNFDIKRGERICIVGHNGCGKTTLLRMMTEEIKPTSGYLKIGYNVEFGYYDQGQQLINDNETVMEEVHNSYRLYKDSEIRGILGKFMFRDDKVNMKVGDLSGGEKARLALLKLMMSGANVLVLDEPTNHLDIESKEIIEDALQSYPGTVITVSHDRYFLNRIPTRILELTSEGFVEYLGKYDYYVEKKESIQSGRQYVKELAKEMAQQEEVLPQPEEKSLSAQEERALKKKQEAAERRREREKTALEEQIQKLEADIADAEEEMCKPEYFSDHEKLKELDDRLKEMKDDLEAAYDRWMDL